MTPFVGCACPDPVYRTTMLIPATVHISSREVTLEVSAVTEQDASLMYALCETCGWDSRRDPDGGRGLFQDSVEALEDIVLFHPL